MLYIRRLIWDEWNVAHIARHNVTPEEADEVCHNQPIVQQGYRGRSLVIGPTFAGRMLTAVIAPEEEEGVYYPVTARPASRRERAIWQRERGDEGQ
jgi:uncharacterized DUF497 family protein